MKNVFYDKIGDSIIHLNEKLKLIDDCDILTNLKFGDFIFHNFYTYVILSKKVGDFGPFKQEYFAICQLGNKWIDFEKTKKANPDSLGNGAFFPNFFEERLSADRRKPSFQLLTVNYFTNIPYFYIGNLNNFNTFL